MISLKKIQQFCQDTQLIEPRQSELRLQCLEFWQLPDRSRTAPQRSEAKVKFIELTKGENYGMWGSSGWQALISLFKFQDPGFHHKYTEHKMKKNHIQNAICSPAMNFISLNSLLFIPGL